jgi:hypothetical protein
VRRAEDGGGQGRVKRQGTVAAPPPRREGGPEAGEEGDERDGRHPIPEPRQHEKRGEGARREETEGKRRQRAFAPGPDEAEGRQSCEEAEDGDNAE